MQSYNIAGFSIWISGKGLEHISGFSPFLLSADDSCKPLLVIELGRDTLQDWDRTPLHSFMFEEMDCGFAHDGNRYFFRMKQNAAPLLMEIYPWEDAFLAVTNMDENTPGYKLRFAVWMAFGIAAAHRQILPVHASTIVCGGKSILFLGESGTGKSTHSRLWLNNIPDTKLLNDDSPLLCIKEEKKVYACGSPWSGKTPCYKNEQAPVAGIVRLSQAPRNRIKRLTGIAAIGALWPSCPPAFACDEALSDRMLEIISVVLQEVPVYSLECLPDAAAAQLVFLTLKNEGRL
ncbi:hypothetical protein FACS189420_7770 [Bacteroidia bacterium]|nr:hypothetical protein FACS189420_7770 [Bacteroidia bacterium]